MLKLVLGMHDMEFAFWPLAGVIVVNVKYFEFKIENTKFSCNFITLRIILCMEYNNNTRQWRMEGMLKASLVLIKAKFEFKTKYATFKCQKSNHLLDILLEKWTTGTEHFVVLHKLCQRARNTVAFSAQIYM